MTTVIKNGKIVTPSEVLEGYDLLIADGIIKAISKELEGENVIDAKGAIICPGFVDIHTHGGYGADFMDASEEAFNEALKFHTDNGTTSVVPTSCTAPKEYILRFLSYARKYMGKKRNGARVLGVHLEGPFLSMKNRGAQNPLDLATPDKDDYSYMVDNGDIIKTVTISPELEGADKMTKALCDSGIVVSGGHDDGIYPEFIPAINAGLSHLTHIFCAMSELRFKGGIRNVGLREYALTDDSLTAEMIADNRHIPPELARLIIRAKGADKVCVVSDSLRCAGMPRDDRVYKLGADEDAVRVKIGEGVAVTADGEKFAGSITPVSKMVKNLIDAGIPLTDAVKMGSLTPARIIKEDARIGSLEVGKRADVCIFNDNFDVIMTLIDGVPV